MPQIPHVLNGIDSLVNPTEGRCIDESATWQTEYSFGGETLATDENGLNLLMNEDHCEAYGGYWFSQELGLNTLAYGYPTCNPYLPNPSCYFPVTSSESSGSASSYSYSSDISAVYLPPTPFGSESSQSETSQSSQSSDSSSSEILRYIVIAGAGVKIDAKSDRDNDGWPDEIDNCVNVPNANPIDSDGDGSGDVCDNCVNKSNALQKDDDNDGVGNACDPDFEQPGAEGDQGDAGDAGQPGDPGDQGQEPIDGLCDFANFENDPDCQLHTDIDFCTLNGWYGDGECDEFCLLPDPDCSAPTGGGPGGGGGTAGEGDQAGPKCGNGVLDKEDGEDCFNCPEDCTEEDREDATPKDEQPGAGDGTGNQQDASTQGQQDGEQEAPATGGEESADEELGERAKSKKAAKDKKKDTTIDPQAEEEGGNFIIDAVKGAAGGAINAVQTFIGGEEADHSTSDRKSAEEASHGAAPKDPGTAESAKEEEEGGFSFFGTVQKAVKSVFGF